MSRKTVYALSILILSFLRPAIGTGTSDADLLFQEAQQLFAKGEIRESASKMESALKVYQQENNNTQTAEALYQLGKAYRRLGRFSEALQSLNQALKVHEELGDEQGTGRDLTELGTLQARMGDYAATISLSEKALTIHEKTGNKSEIAKSLDNIGLAYYRKAEYEKALDYLGRALSAATDAADEDTTARVLSNLASVNWALGEFDRAEAYLDQALELVEKFSDKTQLAVVTSIRALVHHDQGDLKLTLNEFMQCAALFHELGNKHAEAINYLNIGELQMNLGNYREAQESLQESLAMAKELGDNGLAGSVYGGLGNMNLDLGNYDAALDYFQSSLRVSGEIGETRAVAYAIMGIGSLYERRGNYSATLRQYRKGFRLFVKEDEKSAVAWSLQEIGRVHSKLGDNNRALADFKTALAILESIGSKAGIGSSNAMIGAAYYSMGKMPEASASLSKAVEILTDIGQPDLLWPALYKKGMVCRDTAQNAQAAEWMKKAVDVIEKVREDVQLAEQKSGFMEDKLDVYESLIQILVEMGNIESAFDYLERSKARAFFDLLSEARVDPQSTLSPELYRKKKKLLADLMDVNKRIKDKYDEETPEAGAIQQIEKKRNRLDEEYLNLLLEIKKQNPRYADLQYPQPLKLLDAQQLIDEDSVIVDFSLGKAQSLSFVITSSDSQVFHLPGEQKLNDQVQELLQAIQKPETVWETSSGAHSKYVKLASLLYSELLKPAERLLAGKKRIVISADGVLHYLPFESLLTTNAAKPFDFSRLPYLVLNHEIQYVPSVSVLAALQQNARENSDQDRKVLIAFADPTGGTGAEAMSRGSSKDATFKAWSSFAHELPNARAEVEQISKLYPPGETKILVGREATEENAKKADLAQYRIVHFASHGLIDETRPQFSALLLDPGDSKHEDGYLTMREVFDLKLNADLVVLSACKTGLGRRIRGEGLDGLSRAFIYAGTSRVLVSLWNVYDRSTSELMTAFYSNLSENESNAAAALQQARLKMIRSKTYNHPYYWAPFVLIGRL